MSRATDRTFLLAQESELLRIIESCPTDDWFGRDTLQVRLDAVREELLALPTETDVPRPAEIELLFDGAPVESTKGIHAAFVPEAIEKFVALVNARLDGIRKKTTKALRAQFDPRPLLIVGTAEGSFGFQFQEAAAPIGDTKILGSSYTEEAIKDAVALIDDFDKLDDDKFNMRVGQVDRRSIQALAGFFQHVVDNNATLKFRSDAFNTVIDRPSILHIAGRARRVEKQADTIEISGMLYGLMRFGRRYEFQPEVGKWFDGRIADDFDLSTAPRELPTRCVGVFHQEKELHVGKGAKARLRHELLAIKPWVEGES